jgi:hypothetical protein
VDAPGHRLAVRTAPHRRAFQKLQIFAADSETSGTVFVIEGVARTVVSTGLKFCRPSTMVRG